MQMRNFQAHSDVAEGPGNLGPTSSRKCPSRRRSVSQIPLWNTTVPLLAIVVRHRRINRAVTLGNIVQLFASGR